MKLDDVRAFIRDVSDFPQPGIAFKDITPVLGSAAAFSTVLDVMIEPFHGKVDLVAGVEARGFILGAPAAVRLGAGFVPIRKPDKLPWQTVSQPYELEYGADAVEMHVDAMIDGQRVLLIDDVLATGGTAAAAVALIEGSDATLVGASFLIELSFLNGRSKMEHVDTHSVFTYE